MKNALRRLGRALFGAHEGALFSTLITALFVAALVSVHLRHELWRDELHCWSVGRNAAGLWDLLFGDRRYDGHPFLWYYLLFLASRITRGAVALHALTIAIASTTAYLWLRHSRAPRSLRVLLLPSYLFFYEYSVVCRCYILGALLLFGFCALYRKSHVRYVALATVLILLALSSAYGAIMSGALGIFLFTRELRLFAKDDFGGRHILATRSGYWSGLALYVLGIALTVVTSLPPKDEHFAKVWYTDQLGWLHVKAALLNFWWAFLPTNSDWWSVSYWGKDLASVAPYLPWLSAGLFLTCLVALRRSPAVAFSFAFAALAMGFIQQAKYPGGLRHVGNIFLFLLACGWLAQRELRTRHGLHLLWVVLAPCLFVQIGSAVRSIRADWRQPFSGALQAANYVNSKYPADTLVIGSNDFVASAVAGYLDRSFLFADTGDFGQSVVSHDRRWGVTQDSILSLARSNLPGRERVVLVLNFPLYGGDPTIQLSPAFESEASIAADEHYWIYEARKAPARN